MAKKITITRKVQLSFDVTDKSELPGLYEKLYNWQQIVHKAANMIATHCFMQEQLKDFFYLTEETKVKLADAAKDEAGILTMSRDNTTYRLLSTYFKGECPMGMLSGLNQVITSTYKQEAFDVKIGKKSLRSYRRDIPMPVRMGDVSGWEKLDDGNYAFSVYGIRWRTWFGKDLSGNQEIFDQAMAGGYKMCDSSIQIKGKKIFLLQVFQFEQLKTELKANKKCLAVLGVDTPIIARIGKSEIKIGSRDEFLHRRLQIQAGLRRAQVASRFNTAGKGRRKKIKSTERYKKMERNYVDARIHAYTRKLVDLCVKNKCGKLVMVEQKEKEELAKEDQFVLRNWSYYNMKEKIDYKCRMHGIEIETDVL